MNTKNLRFFIFRTISNSLLIGSALALIFVYGPIVKDNVVYAIFKSRGVDYQVDYKEINVKQNFATRTKTVFGSLLNKTPLTLKPVNTEFSIVIPKIGISVPVVLNVTVVNEDEYFKALKKGVAHARATALPGEVGNSYYFAHSSINFWELGAYSNSFNLLRNLAPGDEINIFYQGKRYVYDVSQTEIVHGWDTEPYFQNFDKPTITLQTCDPPGTTLNRLLVIGELNDTNTADY